MEDTKLVIASNIIRQRTNANMTQAELGEKLNYSDKTISKWERAEAVPDVLVLKRMAEIFGVSIDDLLNPPDQWNTPKVPPQSDDGRKYNSSAIIMVALAGIWTIAILVFIIFWVLGSIHWSIFAYAVPVALITLLVLNSTWNHGKRNLLIVSGLVFSLIAVIYIALIKYRPWQLFLVAIPAQAVVSLSFKIKREK